MPRPPRRTAAYTARASGAPQSERGPPYGWTGPVVGQARTVASVHVPVPGTSSSTSACTFASATVATAFTSAASLSRAGTQATTLTVPTPAGRTPGGAAAQIGSVSPTVAQTVTPASGAVTTVATSTPVNRPVPGPARPRSAASSARCASGSGRAYDMGTVALITQRRVPIPPPSAPDEIMSTGSAGRHTSTGSSTSPSRRWVSSGYTRP